MHDDDLAPAAAALWQAIGERLGEIEAALVWGNLALARNQLHELPGSLRLLGLTDVAAAAAEVHAAFEADPRDPGLAMKAAGLKDLLAAARAAGAVLPVAMDQAPRLRRLLLAAQGPLAEALRRAGGSRPWRTRQPPGSGCACLT